MNKIWLVGASEGIGRALAIALSKQPNNQLVLSARDQNRLDELANELGENHLPISLDVRDKPSIIEAWEKIKASVGTIDTLIYCAGYYKPLTAENMEIDVIEKMIDVNLTGAMRILNFVLPEFIGKNSGHIVLIGSIAGFVGLPNALGYGSSKAGIIHLAESLQCDLYKYNIKIQVINPGFVKTRLTDGNKFPMPSIISAEAAADHIISKMKSGTFESRFPFFIANGLKFISKLPRWLYFKIITNTINK